MDKTLQAFGRATYFGKDVLQRNGFHHVTILTSAGDFDAVQAYPRWLGEMDAKLQTGMNITQAMSSAQVYTNKANFLSGHNHPIGFKPNKIREHLDIQFEEPVPGNESRSETRRVEAATIAQVEATLNGRVSLEG